MPPAVMGNRNGLCLVSDNINKVWEKYKCRYYITSFVRWGPVHKPRCYKTIRCLAAIKVLTHFYFGHYFIIRVFGVVSYSVDQCSSFVLFSQIILHECWCFDIKRIWYSTHQLYARGWGFIYSDKWLTLNSMRACHIVCCTSIQF